MEREAADEARAAVRETYFRLRNAERLVALYRDALLPQALASLQLAETWVRAGDGSFADLVDAGTLWYTFQLALARADADREKFLARLESLAERPLTGPAPAAADPAPAASGDDAAWAAALARLDQDRAGLERDVAVRVLLPDPQRAAALAAAADSDVAAADALFPEIALGDLELLALSRSPLVRGAERAWRAALAQYSQVSAVDDVARRYASATGSLMTGVGGGMSGATAARFPFPGMLALRGQIVAADARAAREDLERARREALAESRRLYWGLVLAHRTVVLLGEIERTARQRVSAVQSRYESGQGALADLVQSRIALERVVTELANAADERRVVEEGLRALLVLPPAATLGLPRGTEEIPAVADPESLAARAVEQRQELRRMRAMAERMALMIQMTEREATPGFALDASLFENNPLAQAGPRRRRSRSPSRPRRPRGSGRRGYAFSGRTAGYVRGDARAARRAARGDPRRGGGQRGPGARGVVRARARAPRGAALDGPGRRVDPACRGDRRALLPRRQVDAPRGPRSRDRREREPARGRPPALGARAGVGRAGGGGRRTDGDHDEMKWGQISFRNRDRSNFYLNTMCPDC